MPDKSGTETEASRKKCVDKTNTETEAKQETGISQSSHSQYQKEHMINIYLTDSDVEAAVDFVKDHEELYDKTNERFKEKARCA